MKMRFPYLSEIHTYTEKWERHIPEMSLVSFFPMVTIKKTYHYPVFEKAILPLK